MISKLISLKLKSSLRTTLTTNRLFTTTSNLNKMKVIPVPCCSDNYMYIIVDEATNTTAVVDPYDPSKLEIAAKEHGVKLGKLFYFILLLNAQLETKIYLSIAEWSFFVGEYLLTTHHHYDHAGSNLEFVQKYPNVQVYGGSDKVPGLTHLVSFIQYSLLPAIKLTL